MNHVRTVLVVMTLGVLTSCKLDSIGWPEYTAGGDVPVRIYTTYEAEWIGGYEGLAVVRMFNTGDVYPDMTVCVQVAKDGPLLRATAYIAHPVPWELKEVSDGLYSIAHGNDCGGANGGIVFESETEILDVRSDDSLLTRNSDPSWLGLEKSHTLLLQRDLDEIVGKIVLEQEEPACAGGPNCPRIESVKITLGIVKTN